MEENKPHLKRELGLIAATAIVIGNMIGSGIFLAPQQLAAASNPATSLVSWLITGVGSILLALSFANIGSAMPRTGGPVVFTKAAFGSFACFLVTFSYWNGSWSGTAAIITGFVRYLGYFFAPLNDASPSYSSFLAFMVSSAVLWLFTWINIKGVKEAGIVGIITTGMKILALLAFGAIVAGKFKWEYLSQPSSASVAGWASLPAGITITLWAFLGLESASISAGEIKNPERNVRIATIAGILITTLIYFMISFLAMGSLSQEQLAKSQAPLADAINAVTGATWGGSLIAIGAIFSTLGAASGWILTTARVSFSAAEEKLFPKFFGKIHPDYSTPHVSLIVSGIISNLLLILNYVGSLTSAFNFMILMSTLAYLLPFAFTTAAEIVLLRVPLTKPFGFKTFVKSSIIPLLGFIYSLGAIYGSGAETVLYGFILFLLGIPLYVYMMFEKEEETGAIARLREDAANSALKEK
ncbi:MAG: amino acid permease [Candidatus Riflebacteria bacterium]|nr:amino acid permease [Candidatus Riflebacteria bacterium]